MQEITFKEKIMINAEVAGVIKEARNKAGRLLGAFNTLKFCDKNLQKFYLKAFSEYIAENDLSKIISEISLGENSYIYWVNSVLEDIEYYRKPNKESDYCSDKKVYEDELQYAFYCYAEVIISMDKRAAKELLIAVLEDYGIEFMHNVAFAKLKELQCLNENETEKQNNNTEDKYKEILFFEFCPKQVLDFEKFHKINETIGNPDDEEEPEEANFVKLVKIEEHEVQKISKENKKVVSSRSFESKDEAKNFVENIEKEFPDLMRIFDFKVVKKH